MPVELPALLVMALAPIAGLTFVLFLVVAGLRETSAVEWVAGRFLGRPKSHREALARLHAESAANAAFASLK